MTGSKRKKLVVVGNGPSGARFLELFAQSRGSEAFAVTVVGEEPRPAYDRVHLTDYFVHRDARELEIHDKRWYKKCSIALRTGVAVTSIEPSTWRVMLADGGAIDYDTLVLATGSSPFVPPLPGADGPKILVYRTIEDLDAIIAAADGAGRAAVVGGGLLGLEAARALRDLGLTTHVLEYESRLMARQLDVRGAALLRSEVERMNVRVHLDCRIEAFADLDDRLAVRFANAPELEVDMVVISAGIRPRDELARAAGLAVAERGGIVVDDAMCTSDANVFAVGECANHNGFVYGLIAPCYQMADVAASVIVGIDKAFTGADLSTRLKLMGVDLATIGQSVLPPDAEPSSVTSIVLEDELGGVYKKLIVDAGTRRLLGAILIGQTGDFGKLVQMYRSGEPLPDAPVSLLVHAGDVPDADPATLTDKALICTCNNVCAGDLRAAIAAGNHDMGDLCGATSAGSGCGGCKPQVKLLLEAQLAALGVDVQKRICEHFEYAREELFHIVRVKGLTTFEQVLAEAASGTGCEVCKPVVASILASAWAQTAADAPNIQDTNDRYLANIQRGGTYSVVPRIPAGEITPEKLIIIGEVARDYGLYTKITGAQRIDLFGARVDQLPEIWRRLVDAGFESGHAYAKGMRTVKSCVGSTWCRFGVLDSTAFAIDIEHRYKGLRAPHKLKSAVSGCIRECAEARGKDFGIIATEEGWNLYVGGNGGARPRHADLLAGGLSSEECIRYIDRFLMFYIRTAEPLMRTAAWLDQLQGGLEYLRRVIINDELGIAEELDRQMQAVVGDYRCEWKQVVEDPEQQKRFRVFANSDKPDPSIRFVTERGQRRPATGGGFVELEKIGRIDVMQPAEESCYAVQGEDNG